MRVKNTMRNMITSLFSQVIIMLFSFVCRTIFVKLMSAEYLGLSGLFTNILSVLALSELGIGNAIIINLYRPMAENDHATVSKYMTFYRNAYRAIGCGILLFGLISTAFLKYIVNTDVEIPNLELIYFLYVLNTAISYFCSYKRTILTVDQKEYVNTINRNVFIIIQNILQIIVLVLTRNYILYVCMMTVCTLLSNIRISQKADKLYPFIKTKGEKLNKTEIKDLFKSLRAIMYHKVGNTVVNSTDNIIISVILGVYWVGLYSNYSMIIGIITTFTTLVFGACSASIGNFNAVEASEKVCDIFKTMSFLSIYIYGFCSICCICLFQPFVELWIGVDYQLELPVVIIIVLAFFMKGLIGVTATFLDVTKLFINTRYVPWIMAAVNILVSIIAAKMWGLIGVFLGTVISYSVTQVWVNPFVLYKNKFRKPFYQYIVFLITRIVPLIMAGLITYFIVSNIDNFLIKLIVCVVLPNLFLIPLYWFSKEFQYLYKSISNYLVSREKA